MNVVGRVRAHVGHAVNHKELVTQHGCAGRTESGVAGQRDGGRTGAESKVGKAAPGTGQHINIEVIGYIQKSGNDCGTAFIQPLFPVEVG
ncbi:MAG: hypothetical protein GY815_08980 [Gammaproteobacteria bacterium]|nr:hypothetical protein [Gammaproteobacteria bacterium]